MNTMPNDSQPPRRFLLPPTVLLASILLSLALGNWVPVFADLWGSWGRPIGIGIMVAALGVNIYCALEFRRQKTTIIPFRESSVLITGGLYRVSRNPIYLSMAVLLCGLAVFTGAVSPWIVPPIFMVIISKRFIQKEEAMLAEAFGAEYREYCGRVRRWI